MFVLREIISDLRPQLLLKQGARFSPSFLSSFAELILGFLTSVVVIRSTQPTVYGELVIIVTLISLTKATFGVRFGQSVLWLGSRYIVQRRESQLTALLVLTILFDFIINGIIALLLVVSGTWLMSVFIGNTAPMEAFYRYLWILPFQAKGCFGILPALYERVSLAAFSRFMTAFFRFCIIASCAYFSDGRLLFLVYGHIAAAGVAFLISLLIGLVVLKKQSAWVKPSFDGFDYRQMIRYNFHSFLQLTFKSYGIKFGDLVTALFLTPGHVALYNTAAKIAVMASGFFGPFRSLIQQRVTRLCENKEFSALWKLLRRISVVMILLNLMGIAIFALLGKQLIKVIFGLSYMDAYGLVLIISIGYAIYLCTIWNSPLAIALDQPQLLTYADMIRFSVSASSTVLLTYLYGITGAAVALMLSSIVVVIFLTTMNIRSVGQENPGKCISKSL